MYKGFWQDFLKISLVNLVCSSLISVLLMQNGLFSALIQAEPSGLLVNLFTFLYMNACWAWWQKIRLNQWKTPDKEGKTGLLYRYQGALFWGGFIIYSIVLLIAMHEMLVRIGAPTPCGQYDPPCIDDHYYWVFSSVFMSMICLLMLPMFPIVLIGMSFIQPLILLPWVVLLPIAIFIWQFIWNKRLIVLKTNYFS